MSDTSTSGSTPPEAPAATAGAPTAPAADWGAASGANRGSGLARGKRVSTPAPQAPISNTAVTGSYQPSAVQVLKAETEYQNPFAAPAPVAAAPVVAQPAEAPAPAPVAPVAPVVTPTAPAPKAALNNLPPAEVKHPSQRWETHTLEDNPDYYQQREHYHATKKPFLRRILPNADDDKL